MSSHQLHRISIRVPMSHVQTVRTRWGDRGQKALLQDVSNRLQSSGVQDVMAVIQDPTDNERFTAIARNPRLLRGIVTVTKVEPVEEPKKPSRVRKVLDPGLTDDELDTVRTALLQERNPRHLAGLASTFEPFFPLAAGMLRAKTMLLEQKAARNSFRLRADNRIAGQQVITLAHRLKGPQTGAEIERAVLVKPTPINGPGEKLARDTERLTGWKDVAEMWRGLSSGAAAPWYPSERLSTAVTTLLGRKVADWASVPIAELRARLLKFSEESGMPMEVLNDEIRRGVCLLLEEPYDAIDYDQRLPPPIKPTVPKVVMDIARAIVQEIGLGVRCIDVDRYAETFPVDGKEGFISPTALQLSLAAGKPEISLVSQVKKIAGLYEDLHKPREANKGDVLRARAQMERANRAIERRRWVEWYRRARDANLLSVE